jgi:predicted outer membrane repeat protein
MEEVSGEISDNTLWQADTIRVIGDITIIADAVLVIAPGVRVEFAGYYKLEVQGSIRAEGTADNRVLFTSSDPDDFGIDGSHRSAWNGIRFPFTKAYQDSSIFRYAIVEYAKATGDTAQAGGALSINNFSKIRIENCIFRNNVADRGGAIACRTMSQPEIINNLFYENYSLQIAAVIYNEYSYPILVNNTFTQNFSINDDIWTPSCTITNYFSKPKMHNNILWDNATEYFIGGEIFEPRVYYYGVNNIDQELEGDNIFADPYLEDNYQLNFFSPCLDMGQIPDFTDLPQSDLAGNQRISGETLDLGCYEYQFNSSEPEEITCRSSYLFPNPFNPSVKISCYLAEPQKIALEIYNVRGQRVWREQNISTQSGKNELIWHGKMNSGETAPSGIYFFKLSYSSYQEILRGLLLK